MTEARNLTVFQQALIDSVLQEYVDVPNEQVHFSHEFQQWAASFAQSSTPRKLRMHSALRKILFAAVITILLASTAMAVPAIREAVIDFFASDYEERTGISFNPDKAATAPAIIVTPYHITWIPSEYQIIEDTVSASNVLQRWDDENNHWITFIQYPASIYPDIDAWMGINKKDAQYQTITVDGYLIRMIVTDDYRKLIWTNNEYFFVLELPYTITEEEMNAIFSSCLPRK